MQGKSAVAKAKADKPITSNQSMETHIMKLTIDSKNLTDTLKAVKPWVSTKCRIPIMEYIRIDADNHGAHFTAYEFNSGAAIRFPINADSYPSGYGTCIVRFRDLQDVTNKSTGEVAIEFDDIAKLTVSYDSTSFILKAKSVGEFVNLPNAWYAQTSDGACKESFGTRFSEFVRAVDHVHIATEANSRKNFTSGILFDVNPGESFAVGTDGQRLHFVSLSGVIADSGWIALVDADIVRKISRLNVDANDPIQFGRRYIQNSAGDDTCMFAFTVDDIEGFVPIMDTPYPEWRKVIPDNQPGALEVASDVLYKSIDRLSPICKADDGRDYVKLSGNGTLTISAHAESKGDGQSTLKCDHVSGNDLLVGLNYSFMLDTLKLHKGEIVRLTYADALDPVMIRSAHDETRTSILMPVRLPE